MTTEQPYTPDPPTEDEVMNAWMGAQADTGPESWANDRDDFRAFIAKVKRDAARSALGGLAEQEWKNYAKGADQCGHARHAAQEYRDTHYPEETP